MRQTTLSLLLATCCCAIAAANAAEPSTRYFDPAVYAPDSHPFGRDMATWSELSTQWIYAQPFDMNPFFDETGEFCAVDQTGGSVWYLAPIASPPNTDATRSCTIPRGKSVLLSIAFLNETYPCPDPNFQPPPGESLYDFLVGEAIPIVDTITSVKISLDNRTVRNALRFRFTSTNLYSIKGDPSLAEPFDPCITGDWQPAVLDGYQMMFKPMSPGRHTIVRRVETPDGASTSTYNLYVE